MLRRTIVCVTAVGAFACEDPATAEGPCPDTLRDEIVFTAPQVAGYIEGIEVPSQDLSLRPDEVCLTKLWRPDWRNCFESSPPPADLRLEVECLRQRREFLRAEIRLGDLRDAPVGTEWVYTSFWSSLGVQATVNMHIESAKGGSDAYPNVVSADFARSVRLELTYGDKSGELHFELLAQHFEGRPQQVCSSWGC